MITDITTILADVARRGIELQARAGKVRFRPRSAMTPELARRIKAHRSALLALLSDTTPAVNAATESDDTESGVLSVLSVSERETTGRGLWSEDELAMLARSVPGTTPADLPLVSAVKEIFIDFDMTLVSVESAHGRGGWTRRHAAELIRHARRHSADEAVALRDAWAERLAICIIDGELTGDIAEQVALTELKNMLL
jgi:hypothetical protein